MFTELQQKALSKLGLFIGITLLLHALRYILYEFTPDTNDYVLLWRIANGLLVGFFFAWLFYVNKQWFLGLFVQCSTVILLSFRNRIAYFLDYHLDVKNSDLIFDNLNFLLFGSLFLAITLAYTKLKEGAGNFLKTLLFVIVTFFTISNGIGGLLDKIPLDLVSDTANYVMQFFIILLKVLKKVVILIGFYYMLFYASKVGNILKPMQGQMISKSFFSKGFFVSYSIFFLVFFGIIETFLELVVFGIFTENNMSLISVLDFVSNLFVLFLAARFLGFLLEFRAYSLKYYLGILGAVALFPVLNLIPFFVQRLQKESTNIEKYITGVRNKANIHIGIYIVLALGYLILNGYEDYSIEFELMDGVMLLLHPLCIFIAGKIKRGAIVSSAILTAAFVLKNLISYLEYQDLLNLFKLDLFYNFIIVVVAYFVLYYCLFFIYHKVFYAEKDLLELRKKLTDKFSTQ